MTLTYKVGQWVRVVADPKVRCEERRARIVTFLPDVEGGVQLDRRVMDFRFWNVLDLRPARAIAGDAPKTEKPWPYPRHRH